MNVLRVRKVGEEDEDAAQRSPVPEDAPNLGVGGVEEVRQSSSKGLESVWPFDGDPGVRPNWRTYVSYAAPWEPVPDDGLERYPEGKPR